MPTRNESLLVNAILDAINGCGLYWCNIVPEGQPAKDPAQVEKQNARCEAYNEGVSAVEEAVVSVLRARGFDVRPREESAG